MYNTIRKNNTRLNVVRFIAQFWGGNLQQFGGVETTFDFFTFPVRRVLEIVHDRLLVCADFIDSVYVVGVRLFGIAVKNLLYCVRILNVRKRSLTHPFVKSGRFVDIAT